MKIPKEHNDWSKQKPGFAGLVFNGTMVLKESDDLDVEVPLARDDYYVVPADLWYRYERLAIEMRRYRPNKQEISK